MPGIAPLNTKVRAVLASPLETARKARDFAVRRGPVPRLHQTGRKQSLASTTKMARIVWAQLAPGRVYQSSAAAA